MKVSRYISLILLVGILSGCGLLKKPTTTTNTEVYENVTETIVERDTVLKTEASSSEINALLKDLLDGQERISSNGNSKTTLRYNTVTKEVEADCECGEMELMIKLYDKLIERDTRSVSTTEITKNKTSWKDSILNIMLGVVAAIGVLIFIKLSK